MFRRRLAGQDFVFQCRVPSLEPFEKGEDAIHTSEISLVELVRPGNWSHASHMTGWVDGDVRNVYVERTDSRVLFRVADVGEFFIDVQENIIGMAGGMDDLTHQQSEVLAGMVLVNALALRSVWSLHASAVIYNENTITFLAESGTGKSTLAAYLSKQPDWQIVADDILPVTSSENGLTAWSHFPQLKLPVDAQPGLNLPEQLPLNMVCELVPVDADVAPRIKRLSPEQAVMVLLAHTAGSRLFDAKMLEAHLAFCAQAAERVPVYQLSYPHSVDALPRVKEVLESVC